MRYPRWCWQTDDQMVRFSQHDIM